MERGQHRDEGAAALEFALVSVLLFTLLFGILQFSMLFFQMQAASSTARDAARLAAVGIDSCTDYGTAIEQDAKDNQLPTDASWHLSARFTDASGSSGGSAPQWVSVSVTFSPTDFHFPFLPFPGDLTRTARARVEDVGQVTTSCESSSS